MEVVLREPFYWLLLAVPFLVLSLLARRLRLRWLPAWPLRLFLIAVVLFVIFLPAERQGEQVPLLRRQILLLDLSDSISQASRQQAITQAQRWLAAAPHRMVAVFGRESYVLTAAGHPLPAVDGSASDLASGLRLVRNLAGTTAADIVLATDGVVESTAAVEALLAELAAAGHRLLFLPLAPHQASGDIFVGPLWVPELLWQDGSYTAALPVYMPAAGEVQVQLTLNGKVVNEEVQELPAGANVLTFVSYVRERGPATLAAQVIGTGDPRPENNAGFAVTEVFPSPRALMVTERPENVTYLVRALASAAIEVDLVAPPELPTLMDSLEQYGVIFLDNFLARNLTAEQMVALKVFVSRGGGLVFLGGHNSYSLGGYEDTVLEPLLPVSLEPPPRTDRPPLTFIIVFDRSNSMSTGRAEIEPIELAREAAMRAIEILQPDDFVGVLTYGSDATWNVEVAQVGDGLTLRRAQDTISQISAQGSTMMFAALEQVVTTLETLRPSETMLVLLLSDGQSSDGTPEEFQQLADSAAAAGVTLSTIALGAEADHQLLADIAGRGGGRFYPVIHSADLPEVMVAEGKAARSEHIQYGETNLLLGEPGHPLLSGLRPSDLPPLAAYNALSSRQEEGAEDILVSASFGDPLLSSWQYGLGRVLAWTGDAGQDWAARWANWPDADLFWSQVVRHALVTPQLEAAQLAVTTDGGQLVIQARMETELDQPLNLLTPVLSFTADGQAAQRFTIPQMKPGLYELRTEPPPPGAYRAALTYTAGNEEMMVGTGFAVNYPPEWQPDLAGSGPANLDRWREMVGGAEMDWAELLETEEGETDTQETSTLDNRDNLLTQFLFILIILWPAEIALRRRWLPWQ